MTFNFCPTPPSAPDPQECCKRGCCPCIFDYYDDAFARWEERVRKLGLDPVAALAFVGQTRGPRPF